MLEISEHDTCNVRGKELWFAAGAAFWQDAVALIPRAALWGLFLYMGLVIFGNLEFTHRLKLIPMMREFHPDSKYLRVVSKQSHKITGDLFC